MGILRKGLYTPPANYEAPEIRQRRLYLEAKQQQRKKRLELEKRLEAVEFEEWKVVAAVPCTAKLQARE